MVEQDTEEWRCASVVRVVPPVRARKLTKVPFVALADRHEPETVSGRLFVLGVDVHEHSTAVQVQVHGILESAAMVTSYEST